MKEVTKKKILLFIYSLGMLLGVFTQSVELILYAGFLMIDFEIRNKRK